MNTLKNPPAAGGAGASSSDASPPAGGVADTGTLNVAYHDGPPAIQYFGSRWERGVAKQVSVEAWAAMQERGDFEPFRFEIVKAKA